jgi:hypothetical protein
MIKEKCGRRQPCCLIIKITPSRIHKTCVFPYEEVSGTMPERLATRAMSTSMMARTNQHPLYGVWIGNPGLRMHMFLF